MAALFGKNALNSSLRASSIMFPVRNMITRNPAALAGLACRQCDRLPILHLSSASLPLRGYASEPVSREEALQRTIQGNIALGKLTADQLWAKIKEGYETWGVSRKSFPTHMFHKVETKEQLDKAFDAFYLAHARLVDGNEHMAWEMQNACFRVGEPRRALETYSDTLRYRIWPTVNHFNRFMKYFEEQNDLEGLVDTYKAMK